MAHSFPLPRTCPFAPPPEYERMREEAPLVRASLPGGDVWLVTRHAEAQRVLAGTGISTNPATPGHPTAAFRTEAPSPEEEQALEHFRTGHFIDLDPPDHTRFRRLLIPEFTVRRIKELRPDIQKLVDGLIDDMVAQGSEAELVEAFGLALPSLVICRLLGVPYADHEFFQARTREMLSTDDDSHAAAFAIRDYLDGLVTAAEQAPKDDLLGRLITGGRLTHDELVGVMFLLLVAGHETTANMIPLAVLTLLRHPDQLAALRADPAGWPMAVEELLRFHSIVDWAAFDRVAVEDQEIGGQLVRKGEGIFVLGASANRDERVFERPDAFDIERGARHHVAFGYGVHQCLGQNLARAELEIALRTLFERLPGLRVTVADADLTAKYDGAIFGLTSMPVAW
ncbi:putative cytochrome P450 hydroxylase [[Actinomadura] parvosata subsp. kistnae]|uniref:Cytochrome n=1 Tax=[Actinomadura] parvosata subsp. kistnae TaxID=1909395 RepID=A0A1U9ZRD7_9ACTN|nr:cytochrome P450 [Nonomuraea sp. ATCC 55076]AQZ60511.1 cytochrome [Nonomuraea sp. ATCC 55076]SPL90934.1 putative cytochrome P450 hydroxylase [Actinomadura parvosata subsp. kistnae]